MDDLSKRRLLSSGNERLAETLRAAAPENVADPRNPQQGPVQHIGLTPVRGSTKNALGEGIIEGFTERLVPRRPLPGPTDVAAAMVFLDSLRDHVMVPIDLLRFPLNARTRALIQDEIDVERAMGGIEAVMMASGIEIMLERLDRLAALVPRP